MLDEIRKYKYLPDINYPEDLRKLSVAELPEVCDELREFMIDTITRIGGHFGAGLGVVELTVALHYVFNTPDDKLIFDVGHQGYPHKILTGRRDTLQTIRQKGGLSGFLKPNESIYDAFGAGHASTSISAALGMATARDILNEKYRVAAIIGDGAMTGGMAFEAMNNCGVQKRDITVILNDNNMSIAPNVSAVSNYFNELYASSAIQKARENIWEFTGKINFGDRIRKIASKMENGVKAIITPGVLFESMGFNYFGPINGHNIKKLVKMLKLIKDVKGPVLLHIMTKKGKGYQPAEDDDHYFHAIGSIDKSTGKSLKLPSKNSAPTYGKIFGEAMIELCQADNRVIGITAAMADGTGLDILEKVMPEKVIDVGIAEEHAVTSAAGMSIAGLKPVVAIYSSFLQRGFDQVSHDVALQKLPVVFAIDRAGLVGEDGQTHHGLMDIVYLRTIPNMVVTAPKDESELRDLLYSALNSYDSPTSIRYPRGKGLGVPIQEFKSIPLGKWEQLTFGDDIAILAVGKMVNYAVMASALLKEAYINASVYNCRFIKPLDTEQLDNIAELFHTVITIEDGNISGGFGSAVLEYFAEKNYKPDVHLFGCPDRIIEHASQDELFEELGLDSIGISNRIKEVLVNTLI